MTRIKPVLIALACGLLLSVTDRQTRDTIVANQQYAEQAILREMVPGARIEIEEPGYRLYREGQAFARILPVATRAGYNGDIKLLVARSDDGRILAVRTLYHRETPGLGDVIDDPEWMSQFVHMTLSSNWRLSPAGEIDGITGATITTRATARAIRSVLTP